jgi:hypothetical protein
MYRAPLYFLPLTRITIACTLAMYAATLNFRSQPLRFMYRIFPNTGRSAQPLSCTPPTDHAQPTYPFGSRPSRLYLSLSLMATRSAARQQHAGGTWVAMQGPVQRTPRRATPSAGDGVHARIILAQYILATRRHARVMCQRPRRRYGQRGAQ